MQDDPSRHDAPQELASLYLAGALTPEEHGDVERRLAAGEEALKNELRSLQPAVEELLDGVPPVAPSPSVREALLARAELGTTGPPSLQPWRHWEGDGGSDMFLKRSSEEDWEETGVAGVTVRRLFIDPEHNRMTALFRMEAGTAYPSHRHQDAEECLVLEGDLRVGDDVVMRQGDFQRMAPGSWHPEQSTENGCLLLITSSMGDELG